MLFSATGPELRSEALEQARDSIERLHAGGLYHADLNFHNLFVCTAQRPVRVVVLDFDKARLYPGALPESLRRANLNRLARSAHRLAEAGGRLTREEQTALGLTR